MNEESLKEENSVLKFCDTEENLKIGENIQDEYLQDMLEFYLEII